MLTTVTFEAQGDKTLLVMRERYPSKEALDQNAGAEQGLPEQFAQLDALLLTLENATPGGGFVGGGTGVELVILKHIMQRASAADRRSA